MCTLNRKVVFSVVLMLLIICTMKDAYTSTANLNEVYAIAIDSHNPKTIYITMLQGLYKSIDGGENWNLASAGLGAMLDGIIAIDPDNSSILYSEKSDNILKSSDGGLNWKMTKDGGAWIEDSEENDVILCDPEETISVLGPNFISVDPQNSSILYVGTNSGICKSTDEGVHWKFTSNGLKDAPVNSIAIVPQKSLVLYAGTENGIYKSIDGGENWEAINEGLSESKIRDLVIDPVNPEIIYALTMYWGWLYKSINGGATWQRQNIQYRVIEKDEEPEDAVIRSVAMAQKPNTIYVGTERGVYRSTNGGRTWQAPKRIRAGQLDDVNEIMDINVIAVDPKNSKTVYAGNLHGGMYKSTDDGKTWRAINKGLPIPKNRYAFELEE